MYISDYRFSDDLDFTMLRKMVLDELEALITDALTMVRRESGIDFLDDLNIKVGKTGYVARVYFRLLRRTGHPLRIKLDLTSVENEEILLPAKSKVIIHPYSDVLSSEIKVCALEEMVAEKLRSLFQRTRPRDLYDVWALWNSTDQETIPDLFVRKCRSKELVPDFGSLIERKDIFSNTWSKTLSHQLKDPPDFEDTFEEVIEILKRIIP